jgi:hypothetical protein
MLAGLPIAWTSGLESITQFLAWDECSLGLDLAGLITHNATRSLYREQFLNSGGTSRREAARK